jgi:uncharacterized damage-inducible protein DinB
MKGWSGVHALFEECLNSLEGCHEEIAKTMEGLSPAALDWPPAPEANSISVLVHHVAGSERYWIGDVVMQESSNRDREAEFRARGVEAKALKAKLDDSLAYARAALAKLTLDDLAQTRRVQRSGRTVTVAYALLHALEHAREHVGHIQLTAQMWKQANAGK